MDIKLLIIFIILNIFNVIIQTVKSIATVKCGKGVAAITNAVAYGLYTIVTIYMLCELPIGIKALVVAGCNLIGVYVVKLFEEKARKDKLWKVEATVKTNHTNIIDAELNAKRIPHNFIKLNERHTAFNIYCATQTESHAVRELLNAHEAKYFVTESKVL